MTRLQAAYDALEKVLVNLETPPDDDPVTIAMDVLWDAMNLEERKLFMERKHGP